MKKLLLSALALFGMASVAMADVTENFAAKDTQGWFGIVKSADCKADVTTVTSAETGITYSYIYTYCSSGNGVILQGSSNTPADAPKAYLTATLISPTKEVVLKTGANASTAAVVNVYVGDNLVKENYALDAKGTEFPVVLTETAAAGTVVKIENAAANNAQFQSISFNTEVVEPETLTFVKATSLESGKYIFAINFEETIKLCTPLKASYSYGYMYFDNAAEMDGDAIKTTEANVFDFEVTDGKCTFKDATERYYGMDATHLTSFQLYADLNEGCYWTVEFNTEGEVVLTNVLNPTCFVLRNTSAGYNNIAPCVAPDEYILPMLYKLQGGAGVENIEAAVEATAPVYYNLQGVRVANPEKGLYIRVEGNKATKVVL